MLNFLTLIIVTLVATSQTWAAGFNIESLSSVEQDDSLSINIGFGSQVSNLNPKIEFINETIQFDIPNANVKDGKIIKKIDGTNVKSLLAYQVSKTTARLRVIMQKGFKAEKFKESLTTASTDTGFRIDLKNQVQAEPGNSAVVKNMPRELGVVAEVAAPIDEANIEAELKQLTKSLPPTAPQVTKDEVKTVESQQPINEAEIPVLNATPDKKAKVAGISGLRLTLGLSVVAMFLLAMWVATQRWLNKKHLKNPHTNIRILTQHHLGPKKSLAIISVAGESILLGITEQNINLIKTLSLLDEEIPQEIPQNFSQSLTNAENANSDTVEDFAMKGIKDIVSDRLKGMRNLW